MNLETRMRQSITRRSSNLILRSDLASLGSKTQVTHVLQVLLSKGELIRVSKGVYLKTKKDQFPGSFRSSASIEQLIKEFTKKFGLTIYGQIPSIDYFDSKTKYIEVEIENPRVDRTIFFNNRSIKLISHKKRKNKKIGFENGSGKSSTVASRVIKMAKQHGVSYVENPMDNWANTVTTLAGDEVKADPIKDLIIVLKRAGKISKKEVASLMASYIKERRHAV